MKVHVRVVFAVVTLIALVGACTGSSEGASTPSAVSSTPAGETTLTPTADTTPTTEAPPTVSDQQRVDAALAQLAADVDSTEPVAREIDALAAYDVIETSVEPETGDVTIKICAWNGDTVFDEVLDSLYIVKARDDGSITALHRTSPRSTGDCLNTQLIETALDHIDEFDVYWASVLADPTSFKTDDRRDSLLADEYIERAQPLVSQWIADDITFVNAFEATGDARSQATADLLYRRYNPNGLEILEIVVCRDMDPASGSYRNGALLDDSRGPDDPGLHAVDAYQLVLSGEPATWRTAGGDALVWSDCLATGDWPAAANIWRPRDAPLQVLPQ